MALRNLARVCQILTAIFFNNETTGGEGERGREGGREGGSRANFNASGLDGGGPCRQKSQRRALAPSCDVSVKLSAATVSVGWQAGGGRRWWWGERGGGGGYKWRHLVTFPLIKCRIQN